MFHGLCQNLTFLCKHQIANTETVTHHTFRAEAKSFIGEELIGGEAIMKLYNLDIIRWHAFTNNKNRQRELIKLL